MALVAVVAACSSVLSPVISVRPASGGDQLAYVVAEIAEKGLLGGVRKRVIGTVTVREMMLTADGRTAASTASAPQPMTMRAYMSNLKVDKAFRGKPIRRDGRRCSLAVELMRECEVVAQSWGYDETYLNVYEKNGGAAQLYVDKLGYEVIHSRMPMTASLGATKKYNTAKLTLCMRKRLTSAGETNVASRGEDACSVAPYVGDDASRLIASK